MATRGTPVIVGSRPALDAAAGCVASEPEAEAGVEAEAAEAGVCLRSGLLESGTADPASEPSLPPQLLLLHAPNALHRAGAEK